MYGRDVFEYQSSTFALDMRDLFTSLYMYIVRRQGSFAIDTLLSTSKRFFKEIRELARRLEKLWNGRGGRKRSESSVIHLGNSQFRPLFARGVCPSRTYRHLLSS